MFVSIFRGRLTFSASFVNDSLTSLLWVSYIISKLRPIVVTGIAHRAN
jgi:hypothetical protein